LHGLLEAALHQPGKLLASPVVQGAPLQRADGALWSLHALLAHAAVTHTDRDDSPLEQWQHVIPVAVAVELLGLALDVFDDVQDGDGVLLQAYGAPMLINGAMALRELAQMALNHPLLSSAAQARISRAMATDTLRAVGGQALDVAFEEQPTPPLDAILEMTEHKSGSLIGLVYRVGSLVGSSAHGHQQHAQERGELFATFGRNLGVVLQLENDWYDAQAQTPKSDRQRGKKTLPLALEAQPMAASLAEADRAQYVERVVFATMGMFRFRAATQLTQLIQDFQVSPHWLQWLVKD
jgi:geranylgeranyl pyrophosphate synthase